MKNKIFLILFVLISLFSINVFSDDVYCYQNQANVSYGCGDVANNNAYSILNSTPSYSGNYKFADGDISTPTSIYFFNISTGIETFLTVVANYTKPSGVVNATLYIYYPNARFNFTLDNCLTNSNLVIGDRFIKTPYSNYITCNDNFIFLINGSYMNTMYLTNAMEFAINWTIDSSSLKPIIDVTYKNVSNNNFYINITSTTQYFKNISIDIYNLTGYNVANNNFNFTPVFIIFNSTKTGFFTYNISSCDTFGNCDSVNGNFTLLSGGGNNLITGRYAYETVLGTDDFLQAFMILVIILGFVLSIFMLMKRKK